MPVRVQVTIRLLPDALEQPGAAACGRRAHESFLDPIAGGDAARGWPLGRNVYVSEMYRLLDTLPGVDFVRRTVDSATSRRTSTRLHDDERLRRPGRRATTPVS